MCCPVANGLGGRGMSCNAWNHPPGCSCAFAGGNHGGYRPGWVGRHLAEGRLLSRLESGRAATPFLRVDQHAEELRSFTTPNASCPVCGERVWFYESPHGGRVYFDDLGPPWPKHPCMDMGRTPSTRLGSKPKTNPIFAEGLARDADGISSAVPTGQTHAGTTQDEQRLWQANGNRPVLSFISGENFAAYDILNALTYARIWVGDPPEVLQIGWRAIFKIDWDLPVFLTLIDPDNAVFELHTFRWVGTSAEPRSFPVALAGPNLLARIDRAAALPPVDVRP